MLALVAVLAAAAAVAHAEYIVVSVGGKDGMFVPRTIAAQVGDVVQFVFQPNALGNTGNHSVVQTSAAAPCAPLDGGFASALAYWNYASFSIAITSTDPIWFACGSSGPGADAHCQAGEVGAINAPSAGFPTFNSFVAGALASEPGALDAVPRGGTGLGTGVGARVVEQADAPMPAYTGDVPAPSAPDAGEESATASSGKHLALSPGAIAGIAVGALVALLALAFGAWRLVVRKQRKAETGAWAKSIDAVLARADVQGAAPVQDMKEREKEAV